MSALSFIFVGIDIYCTEIVVWFLTEWFLANVKQNYDHARTKGSLQLKILRQKIITGQT